jgi:hypothetical protein
MNNWLSIFRLTRTSFPSNGDLRLFRGARENDDWILRSVFGPERPEELDALPQRTTLERAVVDRIRQGRHWRMRTGWLQFAR